MNISELFVSHRQVDPILFKESNQNDLLYPNKDRVKKLNSINEVEQQNQESTIDILNRLIQQSTVVPEEIAQEKDTSKGKSVSRWESPYTEKQQWIEDMVVAYRNLGLNNNAIKNLIAKNALESGWGKYAQGAYNFGNITTGPYWKGDYYNGKDSDGNGNQISQKLRAYSSLQEYVNDEIKFLKQFYDFNENDDFETFIYKLQGNNSKKKRYASDKDYVNKVRRVYNGL